MASEADKVKQSIAENAEKAIQSASDDAGSVTAMPISEQIKAAQFLASQEAAKKNPSFGVRFSKIIPPGAG